MKKQWFIAIGALTVLIGAFIVLRPGPAQSPTPDQLGSTTPQAQTPTTTDKPIYELTLTAGKLTAGPQKITATEGTTIIIKATSDQAAEIHLHGYDKLITMQPNITASLELKLDKTGRFEYELHNNETVLGELEVLPR